MTTHRKIDIRKSILYIPHSLGILERQHGYETLQYRTFHRPEHHLQIRRFTIHKVPSLKIRMK